MAGISLHLYNTVHMILENMFKYVISSWIYTEYYYLGSSTELQKDMSLVTTTLD